MPRTGDPYADNPDDWADEVVWVGGGQPRPRTDQERGAYIASVRRERKKYEREGDAENVAACDAEIALAEGQA